MRPVSKRINNAVLAAALLAAGMVGYAAGSSVGFKPSATFLAHAAEQTKSVPHAGVSSPGTSAAGGASGSIRRWRCLARDGGYFTDSEQHALTHACAAVKPELVVWRCIDGGGRAQYTEYQPDTPAMTCSPAPADDPSGWVATLNSPAFRQWIENQESDMREDSRSPDVGKVTALVRRYNAELAAAAEIRDKYADWKDVLASRAFIEWMRMQPAEVQGLRAELTIQNVFKLMKLFKGSAPEQEHASGTSSAT